MFDIIRDCVQILCQCALHLFIMSTVELMQAVTSACTHVIGMHIHIGNKHSQICKIIDGRKSASNSF
jgi:hypothetical protein